MIFRLDTIPRAIGAFFRTADYLVRGRPVLVPELEFSHRMNQCIPCPHNKHGQCLKCSCWVEIKTRLSAESCPDTPPRWKRLTFSGKLPNQSPPDPN